MHSDTSESGAHDTTDFSNAKFTQSHECSWYFGIMIMPFVASMKLLYVKPVSTGMDIPIWYVTIQLG